MIKPIPSLVFNTLAILLVALSIFIYFEFNKTKNNITDIYNNENIKYVQNITQNLNKLILTKIDGEIFEALSNDDFLVQYLENNLQIFITNKYKYIYLLEKTDNGYRFLLDGSVNDDKSELGESYLPLMSQKIDSVYNSKKHTYFTHKDIESLWMTSVTPMIKDNKVIAVMVVDFSMNSYEIVKSSLNEFNDIFKQFVVFTIFILFILLWFSRIDKKRESLKKEAYLNLKIQTKKLEEETQKVKVLNSTLEARVLTEVEKNRQKDQQIIQQARLAQMGEMISMIAHQWRQPLAAISSVSGSLELKSRIGKLENQLVLEHAKKISQYSQHLSSTIDDFRDFFKTTKQVSITSFSEIIPSVLQIVQISLENKNINLIQNIESKSTFTSYPNELKQVILNLIKNAEDALLENKIKAPSIIIQTLDTDTEHICKIIDNAGGILDEICKKIFDPYFSTKLEKNGSGLGLYMSKTIIEEHCEGKLYVENIEEGATFTISLPK